MKNKESLIEIFPEVIGLDFVLSTFLSKFLSDISLIIHPADLINIAPAKKKIKYLQKINKLPLKSYAIVKPHKQGQKSSIYPIGFFNLVSSIKRFSFWSIIYL